MSVHQAVIVPTQVARHNWLGMSAMQYRWLPLLRPRNAPELALPATVHTLCASITIYGNLFG